MAFEQIEKYSHINVESKDAGYPMFALVTFRNKGAFADKGPGKPSPYKYITYFYGELPDEGPKFWMSYMSESRLKGFRKRGAKDISQNAYQFIMKEAFELSKNRGDAKYNLEQMAEYYL